MCGLSQMTERLSAELAAELLSQSSPPMTGSAARGPRHRADVSKSSQKQISAGFNRIQAVGTGNLAHTVEGRLSCSHLC